MEAFVADWISLLLRWLHVVAGAAWVGTSFYFVRLNHQLRPPRLPRKGLEGELWAVHGGRLYGVGRYAPDPGLLPETLHWFHWEAYATWLSGFSLLVLVYYLGSEAVLVDAATSPLGHRSAVAIGIGSLAASWVVYDGLCRSPLVRSPRAFAGVGFALGTALAWLLSQCLSPRAAYVHMGAALGTLMAANVFRVIIPNQKRIVAALRAGQAADPALGAAAAARSLHNNYLTLPVIFTMIGIHHPVTYGHRFGWAVLATLCLIGAAVRHHFNLRARGQRNAWLLPAAAAAVVALGWILLPRAGTPAGGAKPEEGRVSFAQVRPIIERRCATCHAERPTSEHFPVAPLGVVLETPQQIHALAHRIRAFAVESHAMPLGNLTAMSLQERETLSRWIDDGAPIGP